VKTQVQQVEETLQQERMLAGLTGGFSLLGMLLACLGTYGVTSHGVERRTAEIGVRMALGARRADVQRMVLRDVAVVAGTGIAAGGAAAVAAARAIAASLYGVAPRDPLTLGLAALLIASAALLAGYLPARRASRVDPMTALRSE
jgi:ABC-type antimicrobial peptide transport system permease subunit